MIAYFLNIKLRQLIMTKNKINWLSALDDVSVANICVSFFPLPKKECGLSSTTQDISIVQKSLVKQFEAQKSPTGEK